MPSVCRISVYDLRQKRLPDSGGTHKWGHRMRHFLLAGAVALTATGIACADEVWRTDDGLQITYETEIDGVGTAVLTFEGVTLYVEGLAGVYTERGTYSGVWFADNTQGQDPGTGCSVAMVRPGTAGEASPYWGQLEITFIDTDFPSIWFGQFGECFGPLENQMVARPVVAGDE